MEFDDDDILDAQGRSFEEIQALISERLRLAESQWEFPDEASPLLSPHGVASTAAGSAACGSDVDAALSTRSPTLVATEALEAEETLGLCSDGRWKPALEATEMREHKMPEVLRGCKVDFDHLQNEDLSPTDRLTASRAPRSLASTREPSPDHLLSPGLGLSSSSLAASMNASQCSWHRATDVEQIQEAATSVEPLLEEPCAGMPAIDGSWTSCLERPGVGIDAGLTASDERDSFQVANQAQGLDADKCRLEEKASAEYFSASTRRSDTQPSSSVASDGFSEIEDILNRYQDVDFTKHILERSESRADDTAGFKSRGAVQEVQESVQHDDDMETASSFTDLPSHQTFFEQDVPSKLISALPQPPAADRCSGVEDILRRYQDVDFTKHILERSEGGANYSRKSSSGAAVQEARKPVESDEVVEKASSRAQLPSQPARFEQDMPNKMDPLSPQPPSASRTRHQGRPPCAQRMTRMAEFTQDAQSEKHQICELGDEQHAKTRGMESRPKEMLSSSKNMEEEASLESVVKARDVAQGSDGAKRQIRELGDQESAKHIGVESREQQMLSSKGTVEKGASSQHMVRVADIPQITPGAGPNIRELGDQEKAKKADVASRGKEMPSSTRTDEEENSSQRTLRVADVAQDTSSVKQQFRQLGHGKHVRKTDVESKEKEMLSTGTTKAVEEEPLPSEARVTPVLPQTARTRPPSARHRVSDSSALRSIAPQHKGGTSGEPKSHSTLPKMTDSCIRQALPHPITLLLDDFNCDQCIISDDLELHQMKNWSQTPEPDLKADFSEHLPPQAKHERAKVGGRRCKSACAFAASDHSLEEFELLLPERRVGGRNWRGIDRPADVGISKPSARALRKSQGVSEAEVAQDVVPGRWGAIKLDSSPIAYSRGPARGVELGCEQGLSTQYSCQSESWWKKSKTSDKRRQGEYHSSILPSQRPLTPDSDHEHGRRPCGCPIDVACCHWPSGRPPRSANLPPLKGADGGKSDSLGLSLAAPAPSVKPQWLK